MTVPFKMSSDSETCGLLNHFKKGIVQDVNIKCVRIVRDTN